jgi:hypothetical protein
VSYFRPLQAGKTGPRTVNRFPDSTSQLSQNAGQVKLQVCRFQTVSTAGFAPNDCVKCASLERYSLNFASNGCHDRPTALRHKR